MNYKEAVSFIDSIIAGISYPEQPKNLYDPVEYFISTKSKKIRSALTLLSYSLFREEVQEAVNVALSWEFFHNFTLVHDDIMDRASLRRGKPTIHIKWDHATAILSGDLLLILAYQYICQSAEKYRDILLQLFSSTGIQVCKGQAYDVLFEKRVNIREEEYLKMARLKTAALMSACLYSGAILGGAKEDNSRLLQEIGICLGMAFQIQDDFLDVYGKSLFGKQIGRDILSNKKTYLLVSALNILQGKKKNELLFWLNKKGEKEGKIEAVIALYDQIYLKEKTCQIIASYYEQALSSLKKLEIEEEKKVGLTDLINEFSERTF